MWGRNGQESTKSEDRQTARSNQSLRYTLPIVLFYGNPTVILLMSWSIHHVNLAANDVRQTARFYAEVLGFAEGSWVFPPADKVGHISSDTAKLTVFPTNTNSHGDNSGLHLIRPEAEFARKNSLDHNPSIGGHVAFQVENLDAVIEKLKAAGIPYSLTGTFAIPRMRHLYVYDPSMNLIEINEMVD